MCPDVLPLEIQDISESDAPLVASVVAIPVNSSSHEKHGLERDYRLFDDEFLQRSSLPADFYKSPFGITGWRTASQAVKDAAIFPVEAGVGINDPARLQLVPTVRRAGKSQWEAEFDLPDAMKKRTTSFSSRIKLDEGTSDVVDMAPSKETVELIASMTEYARQIVLVNGVAYRRCPEPYLVGISYNGKASVRTHHDADDLFANGPGRVRWSLHQMDAMLDTITRTYGPDVLLGTQIPEVKVFRPDLLENRVGAGFSRSLPSDRVRASAAAVVLHMGERLKEADVAHFVAYAALRDAIDGQGSGPEVQTLLENAWQVLRDRPDMLKGLDEDAVLQNLDPDLSDRLRALGGSMDDEDIAALSAPMP
jgi:hypothetical protein